MSASTVPTALIIASQLRDLRWFVESRLDNLLHGTTHTSNPNPDAKAKGHPHPDPQPSL